MFKTRYSFSRLIAAMLIVSLLSPAPAAFAQSPGRNVVTQHAQGRDEVMRRLQGPERAAAVRNAARAEAKRREAQQSEAGQTPSASEHAAAPALASPTKEPADKAGPSSMAASSQQPAQRRPVGSKNSNASPQHLPTLLFNAGAAALGAPGLSSQDKQEALDEGYGFHQDGSVRKAGESGSAQSGRRAASYVRSGVRTGNGDVTPGAVNGFGAGKIITKLEPGIDPITGENTRFSDPSAGGRIPEGQGRDDGGFDPLDSAVERSLSYGLNMLNSAGESAFSGLADEGRARMNFRMDKDGRFSGEGDVLLPFYDGTNTTVFTQFGARSINNSDKDRWIGNIGVGQRFFPLATGEYGSGANLPEPYEAGPLMLGYNAFFDYDLTRDHKRGGIGLEAQYDWVRLASNVYMPLSGWKNSVDLDDHLERPAKGWDTRVTAYLPWHRNLAFQGAYTQWYGDKVGVYGSDNLESDPKVWSYGLEYTPFPLLSGFLTQKTTERGQNDTEFGLKFTYYLHMPWADQIRPSKVSELRTVGGSRHEFVDREYNIILEYKEKGFRVGIGSAYTVRSGNLLTIPVSVSSVSGIAWYAWEGSAASFLQSSTPDEGVFSFPLYDPASQNTYSARVLMRNKGGTSASSGFATITVLPATGGRELTLVADNAAPSSGSLVKLAALLRDDGRPVAGEELEWTLEPPPPATAFKHSDKTDSDGNSLATLDTSALQGDYSVTARLKSDPSITGSIMLTVGPPSGAFDMQFTLTPPMPKAGESVTIQVKLTNGGSPVANTPLELEIVSGGGTVSQRGAVTDASGNATLKWIAGSKNAVLKAKAGKPQFFSKELPVTLDNQYGFTITSSPPNPKAGEPVSIKVIFKNNGTAVEGESLTLSAPPGIGKVTEPSAVTDSRGAATLGWTAGSGDATLTVTTASGHTDTITIQLTNDYALQLVASPEKPKPGELVNIYALLSNNSLPAQDVPVSLSVVSGGGTISVGNAQTKPTGEAELAWVAAVKDAELMVTGGSGPSAVSKNLKISLSNTYKLDLKAVPEHPDPGQAVTVKAVLSNNGKPLGGVTLKMSVISGGGSVRVPSATTDSNGAADLEWLSGTQNVTLRVEAGDPVFHTENLGIFLASDYRLDFNAFPAVTPGTSVTITPTLTRDSGATPMKNVPLELELVSGDGAIQKGITQTDASGKGDLTFTAGMKSARLKVKAGSPKFYFDVLDVTVQNGYSFSFTDNNPSPKAGDAVRVDLTARNGALPLANESLLWSVTPSDAGTLEGGLQTDANGKALLAFTPQKSGSATLQVKLASNSGATDSYTVVTASAPRVAVTADKLAIANGERTALTATVTDGSVPLRNKNLTWSQTGGSGAGSVSTGAPTGPDGRQTVLFTAEKSGTSTIRASLDGATASDETTIIITPVYSLEFVSVPSGLANSGSATFKVALKDGPAAAPGKAVKWSIIPGGAGDGYFSPDTSTTQSDGTAESTFTATRSGQITLQASVEGAQDRRMTIAVTPVYGVTLASNPANPANGELTELTAVVKDGNTPLAGVPASWMVISGSGSFSNASANTDGSGMVRTRFTPSSSGKLSIRFTFKLPDGTSITRDMNLVVDAAYTLRLTASNGQISNGGTISLTALLKDGEGPVSGAPIKWSVAPGSSGNGIFTASDTTDANGSATGTFTATTSGDVVLHAEYAGSSPAIYADVAVKILPKYSIALSPAPASLKAGQTYTLTATVKDGGTPVKGANVQWLVLPNPGTGKFAAPSSFTDANGNASVDFTATKAGKVSLQANVGQQGASLAFVIGHAYALTLDRSSLTLKNGASANLTAALSDGGFPMDGKLVRWEIASGDTALGSFNPASASTADGGVAVTGFTAAKSGTAILRVLLNEDATVAATMNVTVTPSYTLSIDNPPQTLPNNGLQTQFYATLLDNGAPVQNALIEWKIQDGGTGSGLITPNQTPTQSNGKARGQFTPIQSGSITVVATLVSDRRISAKTTLSIQPNYAVTVSTPGSAQIDNKDSVKLIASVKDGSSNVSGALVNWSIISGGTSGAGFLSPGSSTTGSDGKAYGLFTATRGGTVKVRASLASNATTYKDFTVTVNSKYNVTLAPVTSTPKSGVPLDLTALVKDGDTHLDGKTVTWSVQSGSGQFDKATSVTDSHGAATVKFTPTQGETTVKIRGTYAEGNAYAEVTLAVDATHTLSLQATPSALKTGDSITLTAVLKDNGIGKSGKTINWSIVKGEQRGSLSRSSVTTDSNGKASVTLDALLNGNIVILATLSDDSSVFAEIHLTIDPDYHMSFDPVTADLKTGQPVTLSAVLWDGAHRVSDQIIEWTIIGGNGSFSPPKCTTDLSGRGTVVFTPSGSASGVRFKATLVSNPTVYALSDSLDIAPDYSLALTSSANAVNTWQNFTLTARLKDGQNGAKGRAVVWSVIGGSGGAGRGEFSEVNSTTNAAGEASVSFRTTRAGQVTLRATLVENTSIRQDITLDIVPQYELAFDPQSLVDIRLLAPIEVAATLTDGGKVVEGETVDWDLSFLGLNLAIVYPKESATNEFGRACTAVRGLSAGVLWVRGTLRSDPSVTCVAKLRVLDLL